MRYGYAYHTASYACGFFSAGVPARQCARLVLETASMLNGFTAAETLNHARHLLFAECFEGAPIIISITV